MIVTDLDGTLLDHDDYSFCAAKPAVAMVIQHAIPLVLATSKTAAEVGPLHAELGLGDTPAIVENGSGIMRPGKDADFDNSAYLKIRTALNDVPSSLRPKFKGFGDMTDAEVSGISGLGLRDACDARRRAFSEPGLWFGTAVERAEFQAILEDQAITCRFGGRFLTLSHGKTKADAMAEVAHELGAKRIVALGDAPNDIEMLEGADLGVILPNPHGTQVPTLAGEVNGRIRRASLPGPAGWNASVLAILEELGAG